MKIAIVGTHGIGKTTLAYSIASEAKRKGKNVCIIQEIARRCPFPLNSEQTPDGAEWIISTQISKELTAKADGVEFIVCDRSAYDPICYMKAGKHNPRTYNSMRIYAEEWLRTYDKIFFVTPSGIEIEPDGFRSIDEVFQNKVHKEFLKFFTLFPIGSVQKVESSDIFQNNLDEVFKGIDFS